MPWVRNLVGTDSSVLAIDGGPGSCASRLVAQEVGLFAVHLQHGTQALRPLGDAGFFEERLFFFAAGEYGGGKDIEQVRKAQVGTIKKSQPVGLDCQFPQGWRTQEPLEIHAIIEFHFTRRGLRSDGFKSGASILKLTVFFEDSCPGKALEEEVVPAVGQALFSSDASYADDRMYLRLESVVLGLVTGFEQGDPDQPTGGEGILGHDSVSGFEDVEGEDMARHQYRVGQREDRYPLRPVYRTVLTPTLLAHAEGL